MKIALIGLGMVARTHANAVQDAAGDIALAGVLARDTDRARSFIEGCDPVIQPSIKLYETIEDVAADPQIDAAIICTPPNARTEIVETLAKAGKHILIEKPIERTFEAAKQIVETCETHKVQLCVFLQHRMRQSAQEMRAVLESGRLGDVALVEINVPWWREQSYYDEPGRGTYERDGGGVLISQSIHTIDLALDLLGPVTKVQAMARTTALHEMESEDFVSAGLEFENGAIGSLVASTASFPGGAESITVHGRKGSAHLTSGKLELSFHDGSSETFGQDMATGGGADPMAFTHAWHQAVIENFADAVASDRAPAISGRSALAVQNLIEKIVQSSNEGRAIAIAPTEQT